MTHTTENEAEKKQYCTHGAKSIHIAYSLNNHQPVECTIISDQPFFYMDECFIEDEEAYLDDYAGLEFEISELQKKMTQYDALSETFVQTDGLVQEEFIDNFSDNTDSISIKEIRNILSQSRYAQSLLDFADQNNIELVSGNQVETASYNKKSRQIMVRDDLNKIDQVLLTAQELRRFWQDHHYAAKHPLTFHPDHAILINRAQYADLSVAIIRTAWELQLQGAKEFWSRIENSSMADLGRAMAREALSDFRTLNNGKAGAAVFETWFLSERCCQQDKELIHTMLADYRGYAFDTKNTSENISIELIHNLGKQPFGNNYLAPYAHDILHDPVFTEARDRSNANFLWFIKFERSFHEAEQELQSSELINTSGIDQVNIQKDKNEDNRNENASGAENNCGSTHDGDNVIHLAFGKPEQTVENFLS